MCFYVFGCTGVCDITAINEKRGHAFKRERGGGAYGTDGLEGGKGKGK